MKTSINKSVVYLLRRPARICLKLKDDRLSIKINQQLFNRNRRRLVQRILANQKGRDESAQLPSLEEV